MDVKLTEYSAKGAGQVTWDPARLLPRSAKVTLTDTRHLFYKVERQPTSMTAVTRRSLTIPAERP